MKNKLSPIWRVLAKIRRDELTDCWVWTGAKCKLGYGKAWFLTKHGSGTTLVYRFIYEYWFGTIPELVIDHLCRNPSCCNPAHLEAVTQSLNVKRGLSPIQLSKYSVENNYKKKKTVCKWGHVLTPDSTYLQSNGKGRGCKVCRTEYSKKYYILKNRTPEKQVS